MKEASMLVPVLLFQQRIKNYFRYIFAILMYRDKKQLPKFEHALGFSPSPRIAAATGGALQY